MSKIYRRNCNWCGKYYESWAKYFCGNSCATFYKHSKSSFGFIKGSSPANKYLGTINCKDCGKKFQPRNYKTKFCSKDCANKQAGKSFDKHPGWRGGKTKSSQGYVLVCVGGGKQALEHRVVVEEHIGRKLTTKEHVHHINGIKTDNRIENLKVLTTSEHNRLHANKQWSHGGSLRSK